MNKIKRPAVQIIMWFIIGILGGEMHLNQAHFFPFFIIIVVGAVAGNYWYGYKYLSISIGMLVLGLFITLGHPTVQEKKYFIENKTITLEGTVQEIIQGAYGDTIILQHITLQDKEWKRSIRSKVRVYISAQKSVQQYDKLKIWGKTLPIPLKMNPSDMDYEKYLMSQNTVAIVKTQRYEVTKISTLHKWQITSLIEQQLEKVFQNQDKGIMQTLLIGNDDKIPEELQQIYSKTGIGHVLSISGFHIALFMGIVYMALSYMGVPYIPRYIGAGLLIWAYAVLTGLSTSTVRACSMATLMMAARCVREEEDLLSSLAMAAWLILFINPFQLQQVGFQLSFGAVASLSLAPKIIEITEDYMNKKYGKLIRLLIPWICVTLGTYPILAIHFYEVPLLCSVLNIIFIPLFSIIIIGGWITLIISAFHLNAGIILGKIIILLLDAVAFTGEKMLAMPLGTYCTGKPNLVNLIIYGSFLGIVFLGIIGYIKKETILYMVLTAISVNSLSALAVPPAVAITYLYVGQGDGIVMATAQNQIVIIDGGNFGKGQVLERYIKYRGKKEVEAVILSHSDADHIGGILELLDSDITIKNMFVSQSDQSKLMTQLINKCADKKVTLYQVGYRDAMTLGGIEITYLTPQVKATLDNANDNSLSCLIQYGTFSAVFAGDVSKLKEQQIAQSLNTIDVWKVSHHGSYTSTDAGALLKMKPQYAIISCGISNRYGHPHPKTLETLSRYPINVLRTDLQGAILIRTDGKKVVLQTQIKGDV
ncbi:MAG: internalization-related competence protein ComEC/Rec2 [Clostridia bacterium]|nr:internalization-related competence protein ComEC/Rec2 [Clostridia bacterium]